jgi:RHS repeat-associated protein
LDFFGARYFASAQGRWTSPDWSEEPEPVPYADLTDPQTLNLYAYVRNNPLARADADGHVDLKTILDLETVAIKYGPKVAEGAASVGSKALGVLGVLGGAATIYLGEMISPKTVSTGDLPKDANGNYIRPGEQDQAQSGKQSKADRAAQEDEERSAEKDTGLQTSTSGAGARQRGGKPPKDLNTVQGTEEQLQGVSGAQQAGRKGKGPVIDHVNKSEQDAANARKKIQDLKDAQGKQ